jgi:hypothetical protein
MKTVTEKTRAWITPHSSISPQELLNGERIEALALSSANMESCGWTLVGDAELTVHLLDERKMVDNKVEALREEAKAIRAEATAKCAHIEGQIQNLLALSFDPVAA